MRVLLFHFFILITFLPAFGQHASLAAPKALLTYPPEAMPDSLAAFFQPDSLFPANPFVQINNQFTGTFVSADGLVLTTKKVLKEENRTANSNEETALPGTYARRQLYVKNVTDEILKEVEPGFSPEKKAMYVRRNIRRLIAQEKKETEGIQVEVKTILGGRQYHLYAWETFTDVRLVSSEEEEGFVQIRIYKNEQAYQPEHFLEWSEAEASADERTAIYGYPKESFLHTLPLQKKAFFQDLLPFQIQVRNEILGVWEDHSSSQSSLERKLERLQLEKVKWEELAYQDLILYIQARIDMAHNQVLGQLEAQHPYRETLEEQKRLLKEWTGQMQAVILLQEVLQKNLQLFNLFRQLEFLERPAMNPATTQQKEVQTYLDNFYRSFDRELEAALFEKAMELYFTQLPPFLQSQKVGQKYAEAKKDFQEMGRIAFASSLFFKPELAQAKLDQGIDAFQEMLQRDYLYEIYKEIKQTNQTLNRTQLPEIASQVAVIQNHYYDALSQQQRLLPEANGGLRYSLGKIEPVPMNADHHALEGMEGSPIVNGEGKIVGVFVSGEAALLGLEQWVYEEGMVEWRYKKK
jgi:hypothetical protein